MMQGHIARNAGVVDQNVDWSDLALDLASDIGTDVPSVRR